MTTKTKTPLGNWPGGKKPQDRENIEKNLAAARARYEGCCAERNKIWREILDKSERGMIQDMIFLRQKAEQQNVWALQLSRHILEWETQIERMDNKGMVKR